MQLKKLIGSLPKYLRKPLINILYFSQLVFWHLSGKPAPPPHIIKIQTVLKYAKTFKIKKLIETGTYLGETVEATKEYFDQIYSIELSKELYKRAKKIFSKDKNIKIIKGDSAQILPKLLKRIDKPYVFWLDAHYSGGITTKGSKETPIMQELKAISNNKIRNHVILIDDARNFSGNNDYPTIKEVKTFVEERFPNHKLNIKNDIIRIYPT